MLFRSNQLRFRVPFGATTALLLIGGAAMSILVLSKLTPEKPAVAVVSERIRHSAPTVPVVARPLPDPNAGPVVTAAPPPEPSTVVTQGARAG
jgi:hypothetical protein